jgi:hypothetical protein
MSLHPAVAIESHMAVAVGESCSVNDLSRNGAIDNEILVRLVEKKLGIRDWLL